MANSIDTIELMRRSTRLRHETPLRLRSLDPANPHDENCHTLIVNIQGCAVRCSRQLPMETPVQLTVGKHLAHGRVLNSMVVSSDAEPWVMLGIELSHPRNIWGVASPPLDWIEAADSKGPPAQAPASATVHPFAKQRPRGDTPASQPAPGPAEFEVTPAAVAAPLPTMGIAEVAPAAEIAAAMEPAKVEPLPVITAPAATLPEDSAEVAARLGKLVDELQAKVVAGASEEWKQWGTQAQSGMAAVADQLAASLLRNVEQAMAELRSQVQTLVSEQETQISGRLESHLDKMIRSLDARAVEQSALVEQMATEKAALVAAGRASSDGKQAVVSQQLEEERAASLQRLQTAGQAIETGVLEKWQAERRQYDEVTATSLRDLQAAAATLQEQLADQLTAGSQKYDVHTAAAVQSLRATTEALQLQLADTLQAHSLQYEELSSASLEKLQAYSGELHGQTSALVQQLQAEASALQRQLVEKLQAQVQEQDAHSTAAIEKLQAAAAAVEQNLSERMQQQGWEYDALAEELSKRISQRVEEALANLAGEVEVKRADLVSFLDEKAKQSDIEQNARLAGEFDQRRDALVALQSQAQATLEEQARAVGEFDQRRDALVALQSQAQATLEEQARVVGEFDQRRDALVALQSQAQATLEEQNARLAGEFDQRRDALVALQSQAQANLEEQARAVGEQMQQAHEVAAQVQSLIGGLPAAFEVQKREVDQQAQQVQIASAQVDSLLKDLPETIEKQTQLRVAHAWTKLAEKSQQEIESVMHAKVEQESAKLVEMLRMSAEQFRNQIAAHAQGESLKLEQQLNDSCLKAGGEIKGRMAAAVDSAGEMLDRRMNAVLAKVDADTAERTRELEQSSSETQKQLAQFRVITEETADKFMQTRLAETLQSFHADVQRLSESAISRWQSAMADTVHELPDMLRDKLQRAAGESTSQAKE